jgi:hypothetical protein
MKLLGIEGLGVSPPIIENINMGRKAPFIPAPRIELG